MFAAQKSGSQLITGVFNRFDSVMSELHQGIARLRDEREANDAAIAQLKAENNNIEYDTDRAYDLLSKLNDFLN